MWNLRKELYWVFFYSSYILILISVGFILISDHNQTRLQYSLNYTSKLVHGVYPGGFSGEEDDFSELDVISYEKRVGKKAAFIYFSHNWYKSHEFPKKTVDWIYARGSIPFIRLMLRSSNVNQGFNEKKYSLDRLNSGDLDPDLHQWFKSAAAYDRPMVVEYGIEVNGEWFPWNGSWNGKEIGPDKFKAAYKRIINLSKHAGALNIIWSFHLDSNEYPREAWNRFENYYPGDEYISLMTVSVYGMLTPADKQVISFTDKLDNIYNRLRALSKNPFMVIEFGTTNNNPIQDQEEWAKEALTSMFSGRWPGLIGFSWWNEFWHNPDKSVTSMRVQDSEKLSELFTDVLSRNTQKLEQDFMALLRGQVVHQPAFSSYSSVAKLGS